MPSHRQCSKLFQPGLIRNKRHSSRKRATCRCCWCGTAPARSSGSTRSSASDSLAANGRFHFWKGPAIRRPNKPDLVSHREIEIRHPYLRRRADRSRSVPRREDQCFRRSRHKCHQGQGRAFLARVWKCSPRWRIRQTHPTHDHQPQGNQGRAPRKVVNHHPWKRPRRPLLDPVEPDPALRPETDPGRLWVGVAEALRIITCPLAGAGRWEMKLLATPGNVRGLDSSVSVTVNPVPPPRGRRTEVPADRPGPQR